MCNLPLTKKSIVVKSIVTAATVSLWSTAGWAADFSDARYPHYAPPPAEEFGGWYLRGDIGTTSTNSNTLVSDLDNVGSPAIQRFGSLSGGTSYGVGVGYQFNNWFRADITGEYRSQVNFTGNNFYQYPNGGGNLGDTYSGSHSSWVALVNAYADLGTWWCLTPFVGVGVGGAYNRTSGISDSATFSPQFLQNGAVFTNTSLYQAGGAGKFDFAWALHAGVAYKVTNNFTVELAYRYLDSGNVAFGQGTTFDGVAHGPATFRFGGDLISQDLRVGLRWTCCDLPPPPPPPIIRKG
jgi:opacity protein-like surface antigen